MMENYQEELFRIQELLERKPEGMSVTGRAGALSNNKNTVGRYLDILHHSKSILSVSTRGYS
jgi:hypothetical protein